MKTTKNELHSLMVEQLRDILWAEKELVKALPKMAKAANSKELQDAFTSHKTETDGHIDRLKQVFKHLDLAARSKKCEAMAGLIKEAESLQDDFEDSEALDAALVAAAQKVEHYEIASYGTIRAFAKRLGYSEMVELLTKTIDEEGAADKKLTKIAESDANQAAV
jgi:ferritin-like metal-binding protein YciE